MSEPSIERVRVGRIGKPHGLRGEVTVVPDSDHPDRFAPGATLSTTDGFDLIVRSSSKYRDRGLVVLFEGFQSRNEAEQLRGEVLHITAAGRRSLDDGEFWQEDLVGVTAVAPDGTVLGTVAAIEFGVGQDRLIVTTPAGLDVLVPFVGALVGDPVGGVIEIKDPGGLFSP